MEFTGFPNVIYTDSLFSEILDRFVLMLGARWTNGKYENIESDDDQTTPITQFRFEGYSEDFSVHGHAGYVFYRDDEMYKWFDEHCFRLDSSSEGPFSVSSFQLPNFRCTAFLKNISHGQEDWIPYEDHDALLQFNQVNVITVLTPEDPADNPFSRWVLDSVYSSCGLNG